MESLTQALMEDKESSVRFNIVEKQSNTTEEGSSLDGERNDNNDDDVENRGVSFMDLIESGNVEEMLLDRQNSLRFIPMKDQITVKVRAMNCQIFGTPFANNRTFWCRVLPLAILIGLVASLFGMIFLAGFSIINSFWFKRRDVDEEGGTSIGAVGYLEGEWWWIAVTTVGALLANLVWLLPGAPSWNSCSTTFGQLAVMKGNIKDKPYFILHCFIGLSCGASAGPGMSLSAFGCSMGELVNNLLDERDQKLIMLCGFAAAFSPALPTPFHAVLLALELFIVANAGNSSLSQYDTCSSRQINNPIIPGRYLHDHMEKICTMGFSVVSGYIAFRSLISYKIDDDDDDLNNVAEVKAYHMFSAFLLGILCALMAAFFAQTKGFFTAMRTSVTSKLFYERNNRLPKIVEPFLFPLLGGLLYGLIIVSFPLVAGGLRTNKEIVTMSLNRTLDDALLNGYDEDNDERITAGTLLLSCLFKLIGTAMNLGWCWLGGTFFPLSAAGSFMGAALDLWAPNVFPAKMAIPCCVIGMTASYVPIFLTIMAIVCFITDDAIVVACTFITGITGYTFFMGSGILQKRSFTKIRATLDKYNAGAGEDLHAKNNMK